ncbi:uncharacterized protein FIBRA_08744 [Fibroporia radiculosa]|uniref:Uncharacterized protein n=1 Tax=Fibroporia radiculosa TaxID=599839 RepID=J4ICI6_9APHY|nr:uncharacterized protein FIBRA_08744 [Fibroporia radiculosa]CCM06476.1 predicted protein [Fibroporia radiculosa]
MAIRTRLAISDLLNSPSPKTHEQKLSSRKPGAASPSEFVAGSSADGTRHNERALLSQNIPVAPQCTPAVRHVPMSPRSSNRPISDTGILSQTMPAISCEAPDQDALLLDKYPFNGEVQYSYPVQLPLDPDDPTWLEQMMVQLRRERHMVTQYMEDSRMLFMRASMDVQLARCELLKESNASDSFIEDMTSVAGPRFREWFWWVYKHAESAVSPEGDIREPVEDETYDERDGFFEGQSSHLRKRRRDDEDDEQRDGPATGGGSPRVREVYKRRKLDLAQKLAPFRKYMLPPDGRVDECRPTVPNQSGDLVVRNDNLSVDQLQEARLNDRTKPSEHAIDARGIWIGESMSIGRHGDQDTLQGDDRQYGAGRSIIPQIKTETALKGGRYPASGLHYFSYRDNSEEPQAIPVPLSSVFHPPSVSAKHSPARNLYPYDNLYLSFTDATEEGTVDSEYDVEQEVDYVKRRFSYCTPYAHDSSRTSLIPSRDHKVEQGSGFDDSRGQRGGNLWSKNTESHDQSDPRIHYGGEDVGGGRERAEDGLTHYHNDGLFPPPDPLEVSFSSIFEDNDDDTASVRVSPPLLAGRHRVASLATDGAYYSDVVVEREGKEGTPSSPILAERLCPPADRYVIPRISGSFNYMRAMSHDKRTPPIS